LAARSSFEKLLNVSVLILEDDPGVSDSLRSLLVALGYSVVLFNNGESFLKRADPTEDDVIIVDLGLPDMSGAEILRHLDKLNSNPRIIVISGQPQKVIDAALSGRTKARVLRKPLNGEALTSVLMN
jgi:DNA-binding response OmpR family regulator